MELRLAVTRAGSARKTVPALREKSILSALTDGGVSGVEAPCGGRGLCKKCTVTVTGPVRLLESGQTHCADRETLLACRFAPEGDCAVELDGEGELSVVTDGAADIAGSNGGGLGLAVDVGTTTVAVLLYDLGSGEQLASAGERNVQRGYGADVISRITACGEGKLPALRDGIRHQAEALAERLCRQTGRDVSQIRRVVIAGNTVMEHLYTGLDPTGIGVAPFTPESLFGSRWPGLFRQADVYLCPCISGYVGGDITAGLLASGGDRTEGLRLYVDIGTNGEMALGNKTGYLTCATAAGPAFEGAEIACGMDGSAGAIDRIGIENGDLTVHVIGDGQAMGLCGSGLVDAIAVLLELGVIDETGRMAGADELPDRLASRRFALEDGSAAFRLLGDVYLSARDVRQVQLAKAAIRAGAETLLAQQGKGPEDITELVIAGGFGSFLDVNSALRIGLLPQIGRERIRHAGNAAAYGAALALREDGERALTAFAGKCEYLELSSSRDFMDRYVDCMLFDEDILKEYDL